ncbi:MAG: hypothetical protein ABH836_07315 [Candidatus Omnitrophota bacterium]
MKSFFVSAMQLIYSLLMYVFQRGGAIKNRCDPFSPRFPSKKINKDCLTVGEAVIFEHVPTKKEAEDCELKRKQEQN